MRHSAATRRGISAPGSTCSPSGSRGLDPAVPFQPVLWGRSMGAAIALRAPPRTTRIAALVLESPMVDLDASMAVAAAQARTPFPKLLARLVTRRAGKLAGVPLQPPSTDRLGPTRHLPDLDRPRNR